MKTILLCVFGNFGKYRANSTKLAAHALADRTLAGYRIIPVFFRATIPRGDRGRQIFGIARRLGASGIVCLGMASDKTGLCVERWCANLINNAKYCPPWLNGTSIDASRPYGQRVALDLQPWHIWTFRECCIAKHIPVMEPSDDANGFCCNHLIWQLRMAQLNSCRGLADIPFIFLHIPCSPECVPSHAEFAKAGKVTMTIGQIRDGLGVLLACSSLP